jgi:hypothetical protein
VFCVCWAVGEDLFMEIGETLCWAIGEALHSGQSGRPCT